MGNFISTIREIFGSQAKTVNLVDEQGEELTDLDILDHSYEAQAESLKKGFDDLELLKKGFAEGGDEDKFLSKADTLVKGLEKASKRFLKTEKKYLEEATNVLSKASDEKQAKVKKVMDEWKQGKLSSSSGDKVTSQKQAIAIALSEAGLSKKKKIKKDIGSEEGDTILAAMGTGNTPGKETPEGPDGRAMSIEQATAKNKIKKAEEIQMPKKEFSSEHERLLHVLEHGTEEERKKEAQKQRKEVKEKLNKAENSVDIIAPQSKDSKEGDYANVIVKDKEGRILLLKRSSESKIEPGKWCVPGGHINDEEAPSFAAARELKEESNLAVDPDQLIWIGKIMCQDGKWANYFGANDYIINNTSHAKQGVLALLDGEAVDAKYMTKEQWMSADLIYDLKDHLRDMLPAINAMVSQARVIQQIA